MKLSENVKYWLLFSFVLTTFVAYAVNISGPTTSLWKETKTYTFSQGIIVVSPRWKITGGTLLSSSVSGTTYTATVKWTSIGSGLVEFRQGKRGLNLGVLGVTVGVAPSAPSKPYISRYNCNTQTLARSGSPTTGDLWYWQRSTSGTSEANSNSTVTVSSNGWNYLRAKNDFGWSSSSAGVNVLINSDVPGTPITTGAERCGTGTLTLISNSATDEWFTTSTGGTKFYTGTSYTNSFSSSVTYYIEAVTIFGCRSGSRTPVTATVYSQSVGGTLSSGGEAYVSKKRDIILISAYWYSS